MAAEVGYVGDRTYYTKVGDVYYRVKSDDVLFDICVGIAPEHEISIYVEVDGNVMGSHVGECSTQPQEGGLTEKGENMNESESESFEDSDFNMKNDEVNPKKTRESIDEETLEKEIEKEVEEMNMKEQHDRNKSDGVGSNEEGEEDLFRSEDDFQSQKGSDEDDTEERHIVFNPVEQYDPTFELDKYIQKFRSDPKRNVKGFRIDVIQDLRVNVSRDQAYRAKRAALKSIEGTPELQYAMMHDYANELLKSNPGSTVTSGWCRWMSSERIFWGVLLTAVGMDPNNNIYPVAYAIVAKEMRLTWEWFLTLLKSDLGVVRDDEWCFISDKQKGLVQAFETVFPTSDHRWLYLIKLLQSGLDKPPTQWSRSHFKTDIKCDVLLNNCCETFNSNILEAREKPVVTMLEWIREYLMRRLQENRDRANLKWNVDLDKRSCSCRKWDLNGIPCKHACSAILCKGDDPIDYVNECYTVAVYKSVYKTAIMPVAGRELWTDTHSIPPLPPNFGRGAGRPPKSRRRELDEGSIETEKRGRGKPQNRLKRVQTTVKWLMSQVTMEAIKQTSWKEITVGEYKNNSQYLQSLMQAKKVHFQ
ncbi:UNVERIFIED_CONTAM: hypothetical protein Slati_3147900 [Sesamum latifolium]|uniref:SWIM-type domain-containing protein n=1 Tax=Sesamum latifolium TaxID=2727402 RepID=A0AAW2UWE6_9LAMI